MNKSLKIFDQLIKLPHVLVNREKFLKKVFTDFDIQASDFEFVDHQKILKTRVRDKIIAQIIKDTAKDSSKIAFVNGIPGGLTMIATLPADLLQYYVFVLILAQKISYLFGMGNLLDANKQLTSAGKQRLILYLGSMSGLSVAGSAIRVLSVTKAQVLMGKISNESITRAINGPLVRQVLKHFGINFSKKSVSDASSKIIPVLGGFVSGGLNYFSLKKIAQKFVQELAILDNYTETKYLEDLQAVENLTKIE